MSDSQMSQASERAYKKMVSFSATVEQSALESGLGNLTLELVKLRVSQLNGCAFCLRMHTRQALELGETTDRLAVLAAWWESQYFTPEERAALVIAEGVTNLQATPAHPQPDAELPQGQAEAVTWLAIVMNSWNRIAVCSHYPVSADS